jgi:phosphoribosylamine--glycine ligase
MRAAVDVLKELGDSVEMPVASAHRSPERVQRLIGEAGARGVSVFIVGAGAAAHLAGVVAAHTSLPVIGVPIDSSALKGLDALLSTVQMPPRACRHRVCRQGGCDQRRRAGGADSGAR